MQLVFRLESLAARWREAAATKSTARVVGQRRLLDLELVDPTATTPTDDQLATELRIQALATLKRNKVETETEREAPDPKRSKPTEGPVDEDEDEEEELEEGELPSTELSGSQLVQYLVDMVVRAGGQIRASEVARLYAQYPAAQTQVKSMGGIKAVCLSTGGKLRFCSNGVDSSTGKPVKGRPDMIRYDPS
eukprot:TRINITY_DN6269_c0_g1_i6.p1 TRINITY_DN6269_c0_g1~~TRINITY_DN6269_c0_g1_i6.p1  ORF type:complete len:192 (-),score=45.77 TRINITY_DN6269_c0_g1_i6:200-775(-)